MSHCRAMSPACGAAFVPPPPAEVDRLLDDLCVFVNDDALPPLVQAAIAPKVFLI